MALGPCPEFGNKVSSTASSCPNCGNTDFLVATGKVYDDTCRICGGTGRMRNPAPVSGSYGDVICGWCKGSKKLKYFEFRDPRDSQVYKLTEIEVELRGKA